MSANTDQIQAKGQLPPIKEFKEEGETLEDQPMQNEEVKLEEQVVQKQATFGAARRRSRSRSKSAGRMRANSEEGYRSIEDVDSDELDGDLNLSGEEDNSQVNAIRIQSKAQKQVQSKRPARHYR